MKKINLSTIFLILLLLTAGCSSVETSGVSEEEAVQISLTEIGESYRDIYVEGVSGGTLNTLEVQKAILARLEDGGYTAVDRDNQLDMVNPERLEAFCRQVETGGDGEAAVLRVLDNGGLLKYDFRTSGGRVEAVRSSLYWADGEPQGEYNKSYRVNSWKYTEKGYLFFEEYYPGGYEEPAEQVAVRIKPLDEKCREMNRKYCQSLGYGMNNLFICDWNEADFGDLNFYDIYENFYALKYGIPVTSRYSVDGTVYELMPGEFESVIRFCLRVDEKQIRQRTEWNAASGTYVYRPRGLKEYEFGPDIPWPEVVAYRENDDGTLQLTVDAVWQEKSMDRAFAHEVTVRPGADGRFEYVSNRLISKEEGVDFSWYEKPGSKTEAGSSEEGENGSGYQKLEDMAMESVRGCKDIYEQLPWIENVTNPQLGLLSDGDRASIVERLGEMGKTAVSEGVNMVHYEVMEDFYQAFVSGEASRATVFKVQNGGNIAAMTFICDSGKVRLNYISIGWKKGGEPVIEGVGENEIQTLKLTDKGYLIYAYENRIAHSHLREYLRVRPLSEDCRDLTKRCISGLSYRSYKLLTTNWTAENVADSLEPQLFEDIYYVYKGEKLTLENWNISEEVYEEVFTGAFPVTEAQLRQMENYDEETHTYGYVHRRGKPLEPFGEVVDYTENGDGTLTLYVDCVWPDYDTDNAFRNEIVVQPKADGTFRYLSNLIESREMEVSMIE